MLNDLPIAVLQIGTIHADRKEKALNLLLQESLSIKKLDGRCLKHEVSLARSFYIGNRTNETTFMCFSEWENEEAYFRTIRRIKSSTLKPLYSKEVRDPKKESNIPTTVLCEGLVGDALNQAIPSNETKHGSSSAHCSTNEYITENSNFEEQALDNLYCNRVELWKASCRYTIKSRVEIKSFINENNADNNRGPNCIVILRAKCKPECLSEFYRLLIHGQQLSLEEEEGCICYRIFCSKDVSDHNDSKKSSIIPVSNQEGSERENKRRCSHNAGSTCSSDGSHQLECDLHHQNVCTFLIYSCFITESDFFNHMAQDYSVLSPLCLKMLREFPEVTTWSEISPCQESSMISRGDIKMNT